MTNRPSGFHPANNGFVPLVGNSVEVVDALPEYRAVGSPVLVMRTAPQSKGMPFACQILILAIVACLLVYAARRVTTASDSSSQAKSAKRGQMQQQGAVDPHVKLPEATQKKLFVADSHKDTGVLHNLTMCDGGECKDAKTVTDEAKERHAENVRDFLKENPTAVIMVFAPWCPACTQALPKYADIAGSSTVPMGIVNADMMPHSELAGPDSLFNLQYFPHVAIKKGGSLQEHTGAIDHSGLSHITNLITK